MHAWEAIQKTLDYIEENIEKDIQIEELADVASLSMFYYQRLFSRLVKKPVREYIKLRRLARACEALKNNKSHMVDIAIEYGFISRETFTRAFKEAFGITPSEYRKTSVKLNFFNKPDLLLNYILFDEGVPLISEGLVLEISRKTLEEQIDFVGVSGYVSFKGEMPSGLQTGIDVPGEIWNQFHSEKHRMPIKQNARGIGASYYGEAPKGFFTCFTGEETESGIISSEFKTWTLPARKYIVCGFEAENFEELYKNESYTYNDTGTALSDGIAYYIALNGDLVAVDIIKGEIIWTIPATNVGTAGSGVNIYDGKVYWVDNKGVLNCADINTQEMLFQFNMNDKIYAPMYINDGKIYVAGRSCRIYCIDTGSGDLIWSSYADDKSTWFSGGSVCVGDIVYTGTSDRRALFSYNLQIYFVLAIP